ncbi:MAG: histidine phosphatase family protein, partial [Candidatus Micrarchaeota archaeon]|nr:histidine phosphatase family protein [Candidatus Micrarchaeota archaeon]
MVRIIAVRHGETVENARGIVGGHIPGRLNARGIAQAREAAEKLSRRRIDAIYSSDLARAADTADIIAKRHPRLKVVYVRALREKNLGELQGKPKPEGVVHYLGMRTKHGET